MILRELFPDAAFDERHGGRAIGGVAVDSRKVKPGDAFVAVTGTKAGRMTGQAAAKPGCSGSDATSSAGIQAICVASWLPGSTANGSAASAIRVW